MRVESRSDDDDDASSASLESDSISEDSESDRPTKKKSSKPQSIVSISHKRGRVNDVDDHTHSKKKIAEAKNVISSSSVDLTEDW